MLPRIIFLFAVLSAILIVALLALLSPVPHTDPPETSISLSLYVQQPLVSSTPPQDRNRRLQPQQQGKPSSPGDGGVFIFRRTLTEGPQNTSRVVGKAQGFIIPHERFAKSDFNVIYLTFETPGVSGSLSVQAKGMEGRQEEILEVVGGTGAFAFARGVAVFGQADDGDGDRQEDHSGIYRVKLHLRFPAKSHTVPG